MEKLKNEKNFLSNLFDGEAETKAELFVLTDGFVESLQTEFKSYGILNGEKYTKHTKDGLYKVNPIGRLINVKIENPEKNNEYETLKNELKEHYKTNPNVKNVYICNAGTIMIDCRN
ncbi:MAG: ABC transporter [Bacteroidetes bacterium B1(2017)]|nr:MAG: ABC transporter [Bacteroidetes bacterium B1(2017)]